MSLFDAIDNALGANEAHAGLVTAAMEALGGSSGSGLGGLVEAFQAKGLGDVVASWIGTGQNLPVSAEQIQSVLGSGLVQQLAARVGLPPEAATALLAQILPQAVDRLTPEGTVPAGGLLGQATGLLRGLR
ncbi:MAG TPA: YidB family protein [Verrucomicrobiae bacterium]|nr:YidB family protein [Verrucomicrobiae bacterium]